MPINPSIRPKKSPSGTSDEDHMKGMTIHSRPGCPSRPCLMNRFRLTVAGLNPPLGNVKHDAKLGFPSFAYLRELFPICVVCEFS